MKTSAPTVAGTAHDVVDISARPETDDDALFNRICYAQSQDLRTLPKQLKSAAPRWTLGVLAFGYIAVVAVVALFYREWQTRRALTVEHATMTRARSAVSGQIEKMEADITRARDAALFMEQQEETLRGMPRAASLTTRILAAKPTDIKLLGIVLTQRAMNPVEIHEGRWTLTLDVFNDDGGSPAQVRDRLEVALSRAGFIIDNATARAAEDVRRLEIHMRVKSRSDTSG